jgi:hypothetical protein
MTTHVKIIAYYVSRDRVMTLLNLSTLPKSLLSCLQGKEVPLASAILSNSLGEHLFSGFHQVRPRTLQDLYYSGGLESGAPFIYNGHFYGKGFSLANKTTALSLHEQLEEPLRGKELVLEFSKNGLVNDTAYSRLSGSTRLFAYAYITEIEDQKIRAAPFVIGDLIEANLPLPIVAESNFSLRPQQVDQFSALDPKWSPSVKEFAHMRDFSEETIKDLICKLISHPEPPKDWGGEECDLFSSNLSLGGVRHSGAFLLKGPSRFHPMTPADCGKNGDQIYRLFNIPAQIYVVQHCHTIGPAVRKTIEAFTLRRTFTDPCRYLLLDGYDTARMLRANGLW